MPVACGGGRISSMLRFMITAARHMSSPKGTRRNSMDILSRYLIIPFPRPALFIVITQSAIREMKNTAAEKISPFGNVLINQDHLS